MDDFEKKCEEQKSVADAMESQGAKRMEPVNQLDGGKFEKNERKVVSAAPECCGSPNINESVVIKLLDKPVLAGISDGVRMSSSPAGIVEQSLNKTCNVTNVKLPKRKRSLNTGYSKKVKWKNRKATVLQNIHNISTQSREKNKTHHENVPGGLIPIAGPSAHCSFSLKENKDERNLIHQLAESISEGQSDDFASSCPHAEEVPEISEIVTSRIRDRGIRRQAYQGKVPSVLMENGIGFQPLPDELKGLSALEKQLVPLRILFIQIRPLGVDRELGLRGNVVNIINPKNEFPKIIPQRFYETVAIQLKFMRRMQYKVPYMFETVRPKKVYEACRYLVTTPLYRAENFQLSDDWANFNETDEIDFITEKDDQFGNSQAPSLSTTKPCSSEIGKKTRSNVVNKKEDTRYN
ncbi:unnamed protein product [Allacma fusca]|uniref:DUF6570 domain-containing protein n=1 Tax=Allacma fusca TaxID=39272 RepID=A0A8J2JQ14_9HEXA|nr:unnamed protein product [Allacma fusca]